jgi:1-acyl-sn-glycerol-3-phosphate acyltransferase
MSALAMETRTTHISGQWLWYEFCRTCFRLPSAFVFHLRYSGQENIPSEGSVVVVSNHQSHLDPPLVGAGCRRQMNYLARDTLYGFRPFDWLMSSLGAIPIDREGSGLAGIKQTLRRLKKGGMVVMFPEGTRTRDGTIGHFRPGFTTLAVRGRAAVLPAAVEGAYQVWPRRRKLPRPGPIHVHYGQPLDPAEVAGSSEDALIQEAERRVRACHFILRQRPVFASRRQ